MAEKKRTRYVRDTTIKQDVKDIVRDVAILASPRPLRERKNDLDRQYNAQTSDSHNKY